MDPLGIAAWIADKAMGWIAGRSRLILTIRTSEARGLFIGWSGGPTYSTPPSRDVVVRAVRRIVAIASDGKRYHGKVPREWVTPRDWPE